MSAESAELLAPESPEIPAEESGLVLVLDDEPLLLRAVERILRPCGHRVHLAGSWQETRPVLDDPALDLILVDLFLGDTDGLDVLDRVKRMRPEVEVIVMTGHASIESAVRCMQRGAFDYLAKPFDDVHRVRTTVGRALERRELLRRNRQLEEELRDRTGSLLVGRSPRMRSLVRTIESLRHNESSVLIHGESGTGKELVARAIHAVSPRGAARFVPVDCGALPESIIESELFGHARGAFTGAVGAPGLFRRADGGTLFLDEIGEIPAPVQAKLLRALQEREVRPVGASETVPVDLRVVAATHRDLAAMVEESAFRLDLFYRLDVVRIELPPLRERREDIPLLAQHFLMKRSSPEGAVGGFEPEALERLSAYDWPGNVRELENVVESALAFAPGRRLGPADLRLPSAPSSASALASPAAQDLPLSLEAYERSALERSLAECAGDVAAAAQRLGIGRSTLYRKLARHGLGAGRRPVGARGPIR